MNGLLTVIGLLAATVIVVVPLAAILLVSFASLHEESARSLSGTAPNLAARVARRLLGFRAEPGSGPGSAPAPVPTKKSEREVRFAYARVIVPNPGQQPIGRQLAPSPVRHDQRQPAGV